MKVFGLMLVIVGGGCLVADEEPEGDTSVEPTAATTSAVDVSMHDSTLPGVPRGCPTSFATGAGGDAGAPQTKLWLKPDFAPDEYDWKIIQPSGSLSLLEPSASAADPTFEANVAGSYTITLDSQLDGNDCEPVTHVFHAVPQATLHIELLWHTPNDSDESNQGPVAGSDLDLHFLHPNGAEWFDRHWDIFWLDRHPRWWSSDGSVSSEPRLDRDDVDGGGPENINVDWLEPGACYRIGVHYWDDHEFGRVEATVRVYRDASLVFEQSAPLVKRDFWSVVEVCTDLPAPQPFAGCEAPCIAHEFAPPGAASP